MPYLAVVAEAEDPACPPQGYLRRHTILESARTRHKCSSAKLAERWGRLELQAECGHVRPFTQNQTYPKVSATMLNPWKAFLTCCIGAPDHAEALHHCSDTESNSAATAAAPVLTISTWPLHCTGRLRGPAGRSTCDTKPCAVSKCLRESSSPCWGYAYMLTACTFPCLHSKP